MTDTSVSKQIHKRIDQLEAAIVGNLVPIDVPVAHYFTRGMYIREVSIAAGSMVTSKIHKTQHPFTLSKGKVKVMLTDGSWKEITAPFTGITECGTRRVVIVLEDCVWTTYHHYSSIKGTENALPIEDQEKIADRIEGRIIQKHYNSLINNRRKELWHG